MYRRLLILLVIQFGLAGSILAEPSKLAGEALRQVVSGRTVLIATAIGSFPIHYKSSGTMTGQVPAFVANLGTERDRGRWWIADDRLASVGTDGLPRSDTASSCNMSAESCIGCAMMACPVRPSYRSQ